MQLLSNGKICALFALISDAAPAAAAALRLEVLKGSAGDISHSGHSFQLVHCRWRKVVRVLGVVDLHATTASGPLEHRVAPSTGPSVHGCRLPYPNADC